jgi:hypothetical protein
MLSGDRDECAIVRRPKVINVDRTTNDTLMNGANVVNALDLSATQFAVGLSPQFMINSSGSRTRSGDLVAQDQLEDRP